MARAWERRIALIVAGGGYGKTTAMRQLGAGPSARWLALTGPDREVEVLSLHIAQVTGLRLPGDSGNARPAIGASDRGALADGQAAAICERLDSLEHPTMLVLDDVDQLADEDSSTRFLSALCLQAPSHVHIVLGGRRLPRLGLGSVSGRGELLELAAPDLAFTIDETAALLVARLGPDAEPLAPECWSLTAGWVAALQLIADRLARIDTGQWRATLSQLGTDRGQIWGDFAADLIEREPASARRVLAVASLAPSVDQDLLSGLGVPQAAEILDGLQRRGLLVVSGERGARTLSPVLADAVSERLSPVEADELRNRAARWLEQAGRLEEALECCLHERTHGAAVSLLRRCGSQLVVRGYGSRVDQVLRDLAPRDDLELETVRAEALVATGDWDGATELFGDIQRRTAGAPLPSSTAWRFGALLYLRGETEAAVDVLSSAQADGGANVDDALVSAWLGSALWVRGDVEEAERIAEVSLRQAEASGDAAARAAAHVAVGLAAASSGDRERNERHHRLGLSAARDAGDSVQMARIHANLSSKAVEDGDYPRAIAEADEALSAGPGHDLFAALAMCNKADALLRTGELDEARGLLVQAIEMFAGLGSLQAFTPYILLGTLETERGELTRARLSLERAQRLAEQAGDVHGIVFAIAGLARILAQDDPDTARRHAIEATEQATSLERAPARCVWSWVELCAGDRGLALRLAAEAESEARATDDLPSVARALELQGAASEPPDQERLAAAAALWRELGDPIAAGRVELILAGLRGQAERGETLRRELSRRGVLAEVGVAGLLLAAPQQAAEVTISTLGRFTVARAGQPIPLAAWQSRKARDLLKLLASRRGRAVTRDAAAEELWPNEEPEPLPNRLSVALSTLRKVLDPDRLRPPDYFVSADNRSLALRVEHLSLDVIVFMDKARAAVEFAARGDWAQAEPRLREAENLYTGDFLDEDLYEDWAVACREEARSAAQEVSRLLARAAVRRGDDEEATRHLRRLLERDVYDADAWAALLGAQLRLHRYGEARRQHTIYSRHMAELGLSAVPLAGTIDARP